MALSLGRGAGTLMRVDLGLSGKVAIVTGASRGIGRATVEALLAEDVKVVAGARDISSLSGLVVHAVAVDLSTCDGPESLVEAAIAAYGGVDFLVNNVGVASLHFDGFVSVTEDDWMRSFQTNFMSAVRAVRAALPQLITRRGAIVNVSSLNARVPAVEAPEYGAMKAALNSISRALAVELGPKGVRVNALSPGPVLTDMQVGPGGFAEQVAAASGATREQFLGEFEKAVALGRLAQPAEIATVILLLLSERTSFVSGADVAVDGATQIG